MKYRSKNNSFDLTVKSLCEQIDILTEDVQYWKQRYEEEKLNYNKLLNQQLEDSKKALGNAFKFALMVEDDENGNLIINKENRNNLAKDYLE